ncbi:MAG: SIMPL domain-containing protein [Patescibacteria group bacterium]|jgi:hypothetical protein
MASWEKNSTSIWPTWQENKLFTVLLGILMVYGIIWMGITIKTAMQESRTVGFTELSAPTISVSATGKASAVPDIATVDITVTKTADLTVDAQNNASIAMTAVIEAVKALGVPEADMKTSSFTTSETYDYDQTPPVVAGYESSQTLTVKIRNTDLISSVLDAGPVNGATSVSSLRYEIDDETAVQQEARVEAMAKAKKQAKEIASAMGARLGRAVSYSESVGGSYPMFYGIAESSLKSDASTSAPVETGTQDVELTVFVTYSLR